MKTSIKIGLLVLVGMFSACSDKETDNKIIDATKDIKFKVDFADYNAEQEFDVTRATNSNGRLNQQVVNLGNGILALCTLQRDTTQQNKSIATRVLPNDTYTMLAYDHTTHAFKGEMTGTIVGGAFAASGGKKSISLPPATYDFVLFNSKVTRSGNQLSVARSNIAGALIGRTTQTLTATPEYQSVSFTLKHVGAKVRMKITGYRQFTNAKATLSSSAVPGTIVYDATTGVQTAGSNAAMSESLTFGSGTYNAGKYIGYSGQETSFIPGTNVASLILKFTGGSIYSQNMGNAPAIGLHPVPAISLQQNGAYVLNVKLAYSFYYLMSDGSIGMLNQTIYGGGNKTPIGVVLSQSNSLAIALNDANNRHAYSYGWGGSVQFNTTMSTSFSDNLNDMHGYDYTWTSTYCTPACDWYTPRGNSMMSPGDPAFPAFYAAGQYTPRPGSTYWHLPSMGEWAYVYTALGGGDLSALYDWGEYSWNGDLAYLAFDQVNGQRPAKQYWTSSEYNANFCISVAVSDTRIKWDNSVNKGGFGLWVRPFINY